jgi:hypothetical protein
MTLRWFCLSLIAVIGAVVGTVLAADRHGPAAELPVRRVERAQSADGRYTITATEFMAPTCVPSDVGVRFDRHDRTTRQRERWYRCGSIPDDLAQVRRPPSAFFRRMWGDLWPSVGDGLGPAQAQRERGGR